MRPNSMNFITRWKQLSWPYKAIWVIAILWMVLHIMGYIFMALSNGQLLPQFAQDAKIYLDAGRAYAQHGPIYDMSQGLWQTDQNFRYHPLFALVFSWFLNIPANVLNALWLIPISVSYIAGVFLWYYIFVKLPVPNVDEVFKYLPIAFVSGDWIGNLVFANEGPSLVLLSAAIVLLLIDRRAIWAGIIVALVLLTKVQWAVFPLVLILVFKEWRLLFKTVLAAGVAYIAMTAFYIVVSGLDYGISSYKDYVTFILSAGRHFPWQGAEAAFDTFNNSLYQSIVRYVGFVSWAGLATALIELSLFAIIAFFIVRAWQANISRTNKPEVALILAVCVYFLSILTLLQIEETVLAGVIFPLLWAFHNRKINMRISPYFLSAFSEIPDLIAISMNIPWLYISSVIPITLIALVCVLWGCVTYVNDALRSEARVYKTVQLYNA